MDPDAAFAFDAGSGFEDLVVGNAGDGELSLFEGGPDGLGLTSHGERAEPARPDGAGLLGVDRRPGAVLRGDRGPRVGRAGGAQFGHRDRTISTTVAHSPRNEVAQLVSLHESSLPLVATVLTLTIAVSGEELNLVAVETEATAVAAFLPGTGISVGQGLSSQRNGGLAGDDGAEPDESKAGVAGAVPTAIAPWERYRDRSGRGAGEVPAGEPQRGFGSAGSGLVERSSRLVTGSRLAHPGRADELEIGWRVAGGG